MTDTEQLSALHTAVGSYLSTLLAISECLGAACPEVGATYRHRLSRLRSRLAFDVTPEAMIESTVVVERELADYSKKAAQYLAEHAIQIRRAVEGLETIVNSLAQRQDFYGARLRQFAEQMQSEPYPTDAEQLSEVVALQVSGLMGCVESMGHDSQSLVARMHAELAGASQRLREAEITDQLTGLINRREMQRRIEQSRAAGQEPVVLVFELTGDVRDEVAQQAAARISSQFRHKDLVCRWTEREFLVLFHGTADIAQERTEEIVPWITGRYALANGESVDIGVEAGVIAVHLLTMQ
jgi:GGDEF domain-containing protein